jgi:hypothetical protein
MAEQVSSLLRRSVQHLAYEVPDSYRLLSDELGPMVVELDVDGEVFSLTGGAHVVISDGAAVKPGVRIGTSRQAILGVLDAEVTLGEAVEAGTVTVQGSLDDVQRVHDSLLAYVHAAVRASSQPALLAELRAGAR